MATPIDEVYVLVSPDVSRFAAELKAKLNAAFKAVGVPQIEVEPDTSGFTEKVKRETTRTERTVKGKVPVAPDLSKFSAEVRTYLAKFDPKEQVKIVAALDRAALAKSVAEAKKLVNSGLEPDRNSFQRALKNAITPHPELFEALKRPLARTLSTPLGLAIAAGLTQTLLVAIPAAISLGLGAGLIALGAFALRGSKILKDRFKAAGGVISESLRQAAQPLKGPFLQAINTFTAALLQLQPQLRGLFKGLAPSIKPFVDGITGFVRRLLPGLQAAMPAINAAFAQFGARLPGLGAVVGRFFETISSNLPAITRGVDIFFSLTEAALKFGGAVLQAAQFVSTGLEKIGRLYSWLENLLPGVDKGQKDVAASGGSVAASFAAVALASQEAGTKAAGLAEKLKPLKQEYREQVAGVRATIQSYQGLITQSGVTAAQVVKDLHNQVVNFRTYAKDVKRLIKEGVSPAAIKELSEKGPQFVHALATGSNRELERYKRFWKQRQDEVRGSFAESMELQLQGLAKKIKAMQKEINKLKGREVIVTARGVFKAPKGIIQLPGGGGDFASANRARGGPIFGPGTGTSDSIPAWLSHGEHVWTAAEVRKAGGHGVMEAWRRMIRGFAAGGAVGDGPGSGRSFGSGLAAFDALINRFALALGKSLHGMLNFGATIGHAAGAWKAATNFLTQLGIPYSISSTFRQGAVTHASGRQSYHALNRAVDLTGPNMLAIWKALVGTNPTELIYSRAPRYKSRGGWKPISQLDPITRADHFDHVHAAYDKGGLLMPGITMAENRTGLPERVTPASRDRLGRVTFGGQGIHVENLIVQPLSGQFRLRDVLTELALQGVR